MFHIDKNVLRTPQLTYWTELQQRALSHGRTHEYTQNSIQIYEYFKATTFPRR